MYKIFVLLFSVLLLAGCNKNKLDPKHLTNITVARHVENADNTRKKKTEETVSRNQNFGKESSRSVTGKVYYYIIVASYPLSERNRAEKLNRGLQEKGYSSQIIEAIGRLRVSIEKLESYDEACEQRDRYRDVTDRQDIWILKMENQ